MQHARLNYGIKGFVTLYTDALKWHLVLQPKAKYKAKVLVFRGKHGLGNIRCLSPHPLSQLPETSSAKRKSGEIQQDHSGKIHRAGEYDR